MQERLLDKIAEPFNLQLPEYRSMEEMIDDILPVVEDYGDSRNLADETSPLYHVSWRKMTDKPGENEIVIHKFQGVQQGEIFVVTDGKVSSLAYSVMEDFPNRIVIGESVYRNSLMYVVRFIDQDFMILQRHGNPDNIKKKYLFYAREAIGTRLTWDESLERLASKYRDSNFPMIAIGLLVALIIALLFYFI